MLVRVAPGVVDVQRRAVVDQPWPAVPHEQVRVLRRSVRVGHEGIEPDDVGGEVRVDPSGPWPRRVERQRARQEVHPEVQAAARVDQVVDLLVGLGVAQGRVDLDADELGHGQPDGPRDLAGQPLGHERPRTLAGAAELHDVQPVVVRLDQTGQRAALAQGRDVAGGDHGSHQAAARSGLYSARRARRPYGLVVAARAGSHTSHGAQRDPDYASPMTDYDQRSLLIELEPEAGRLYDRHASVAQEWFPHDYIPYRLGRDFDKEPWTPDQPRLTGVAQTAFEIGLLTEDNLPSYHRLIHGMFGKGDGAWINWVGRWTAEEGRHAIVLRDYLTVTRNIDPIMLERGRMTQLQQGYDHDAPDTLRGLAYVAFQELATRIAHRNTGRYSDDPVADKIMVRIAADENLHMVFYRDILAAAIVLQPSAAVCAIVDEVLAFQMPGAGIPGFIRKAAQIAKAGIYDLRVHRDEVLMPIIRHWRIFELSNLDEEAEAARTRLAEHLEALEVAARKFEEKMSTSTFPRISVGG